MRSEDADHAYNSYNGEEEKEDKRAFSLFTDTVSTQQQAQQAHKLDASTVVGALTSVLQLIQPTPPTDHGTRQQARQANGMDTSTVVGAHLSLVRSCRQRLLPTIIHDDELRTHSRMRLSKGRSSTHECGSTMAIRQSILVGVSACSNSSG